jgi:hypothetical protein
MTTLATLYDADARQVDPAVAELAAKETIPHPLHGVTYADGADHCNHGRRCNHPAGGTVAR